MNHKRFKEGNVGDNIGINIGNLSAKIRRGTVAGDLTNNPPKAIKSFIAQIIVLSHPGHLCVGYTPIMHCHTMYRACKISAILERIDRRTKSLIEHTPEFIKSGDTAIVQIDPLQPLCVETFADYPQLGRFVLRDLKQTVAVGVIKSVSSEVS